MTLELMPKSFWRFPAFWDDEDWTLPAAPAAGSGLAVSEDDQHVYVEAAVPGLEPKDVEVTFEKGVLWIKGESKSEEKNRKYYRRATSAFSYRVAVPGNLDEKAEPEATYEKGVMKVTFRKKPETAPKKIAIKAK